MTAPIRYEVSSYIGPCSEEEATAVADAILDLPEHKAAGGGGVSLTAIAADDPLFAEDKAP